MEESSNWIIRKVTRSDNKNLYSILSSVMIEFDVPFSGTALSDPELEKMFETYQTSRSVYFIIEKDNKIFGGAGISQLKNSKENICELQKMYFLSQARGVGLGRKMIEKCLIEAKNFGFEKCYIETMYNMKSAQKLYLSLDFKYINQPIGNTGHSSCPVWMLKKI
tara:strand:+ start:26301 stop:26795 length:495 start_codon:yes stop_codon:yes gene_type:complete